MGLEVTGVRELQAKMQSIGEKAAKVYARNSMRPAGEIIRREAQSLAPHKTGQLREAIHVNGARGSSPDEVAIVVAPGKKWFKGGVFYAAMQEFGWFLGKRLRNKLYKSKKFGAERYREDSIKAGRRLIEGQHYMVRAYEATKSAAEASIAEEMTRALEDEWNGT
jgi:HK97 gp10 family phage protein